MRCACLAWILLLWTIAGQAADAASPWRWRDAALAPGGLVHPDASTTLWQPVVLPHRHAAPAGDGAATHAWFRIAFTAGAAMDEPWMVYLPRLRDGGAIFLNGTLLGTVGESDATTHRRWMRPHLFAIAADRLQPGENAMLVRLRPGDQELAMSSVFAGPEREVRPLAERRHFIAYTAAQITVAATLGLSAFVIGIWLKRRMEFDYGLFGLATLFWGLHTANYVVEVLPMWAWLPWRVLRYAATGGFVVAMTLFMLRFAGIRRRGFTRAFTAYWLSGPLLLAVGGVAWHGFVDRYYQAGLIGIAAFMVAVTVYAGSRQRTPGALALCAAVLAGILAGVHDYLVSQGIGLDPEQPYLLFFAADALLIVVGVLLADRFVTSLEAAERVSETLAIKVAERERELAASYAVQQEQERKLTVVQERQRIMQDMHDGLGSQLLTALVAVERGTLDARGTAQVLREAMDDMRLAIDTLAPGSAGLIDAFGNLRARLEPRFRAVGVVLSFSLRGLPDRLELPPDHAMQILRILQESLANVIKHAHAARATVTLAVREEPRRLEMRIADDGKGFGEAAGSGRGVGGMHRRAAQIGAALAVESGTDGTRVVLTCPLPDAAAKP